VVVFTSRPLYPHGERAFSTHWLVGWVGSRAGLGAVAKRNHPCPYRESKPSRLARSLVTLLAELPRLQQVLSQSIATVTVSSLKCWQHLCVVSNARFV